MQDQNFHEIQLSGKQLLFGFISAVVLLVVIFLLGVSVGRGVRGGATPGGSAGVPPAAPGDTTVSTPNAAAAPQPGDLTYQQVLKGGQPTAGAGGAAATDPSASPPPPSSPPADPAKTAAEPPPPAPETTKPLPDRTKPAEATTPAPPPAAATPPVESKTPPATGGWFAQLGAYGTRRAADGQVGEAAAKGFKATVTRFGSLYRVRVGPFPTQADAEREQARLLKAGIPSSVIR